MQSDSRARQAVTESGISGPIRIQMCIVAGIPLAFCVFAAVRDPAVAQKSAFWGVVGIGVVAEVLAILWTSMFRLTVSEDSFTYRRLFGGTTTLQFSQIRRAYFGYEQAKGRKYARFYIEPTDGRAMEVNVMVFPGPVVGRLMAALESHGIQIEGASFLHAKAIMAKARRYYPAGSGGPRASA